VTSSGLYTNRGCDNIRRDAGAGFPFDAGEDRLQYNPIFDGCDRWATPPGSVVGAYPNRRPVVTGSAYVANYVIVGELREVNLSILGESATAGYGYFIGVLLPQDGQQVPHKLFRLEGYIAGRMLFDQVVNIIARTQVSPEDSGLPQRALCETDLWPVIKQQLCSAADTMDIPAKDHQGLVCNAATATIGFVASKAEVDDLEFKKPMGTLQCSDSTVVCKVP